MEQTRGGVQLRSAFSFASTKKLPLFCIAILKLTFFSQMQNQKSTCLACVSHPSSHIISFISLGDIHVHRIKTRRCFVCLLLPHTVLKYYYDKDDGVFSLVVLVFFEQRARNKAKEYWKEKSQALCQNEGGKSG